MTYWRVPLSLTLRAPWCTPGSTAGNAATDIALARNARGDFILPASLVRGTLRGALQSLPGAGLKTTLSDIGIPIAEAVNLAFGVASGPNKDDATAKAERVGPETWRVDNEPRRGLVSFTDLSWSAPSDESASSKKSKRADHYVRVHVDADLGAAKEGQLVFIECPLLIGELVTFSGEVVIQEKQLDDGTLFGGAAIRALLNVALSRLVAIGGMKSAGFGRVETPHLGDARAVHPAAVQEESRRVFVQYSIDQPFLVSAEQVGSNLSVGSDKLSGAVIKGTLARALELAGKAGDFEAFLASLSVSEARLLTASGALVRPLPRSLAITGVKTKTEQTRKLFCHLSLEDLPGGRHRFAPDWKGQEEEEVGKHLDKLAGTALFTSPNVRTLTRTRNRIDPETGSVEREALFSETLVDPAGLAWGGFLDARKTAAPELLAEVLGLLQAGVPGLGSTRAVLTGDVMARPPFEDVTYTPTTGKEICLMLTSPAYLFPARDLRQGRCLKTAYATYFRDHGLELSQFYAHQTLIGGYLALRYPVTEGGYEPWILTSAGSVFHLTVTDDASAEGIQDLLDFGLPPFGDLDKDRDKDRDRDRDLNWQNFPFLREAGFGAVVLNAVNHRSLAKGARF